jgi:peptidoglycan/LPS O-acetylase OafA/YrhL
MSSSTTSRVGRFYSLDVLRGVAALSVVFWHWQHFFPNGAVGRVPLERLPLDVFFPFYAKGWLAVELFFTLSGFIFFWLYCKPIAARSMSAIDFSILRFSRLYPLHFATLAAVAAGQLAYHSAAGVYFIYSQNDAYHLLLNVLFVPSWGFEKGWSFNAPVWSVSVEVFLYLLFFIVCRLWSIRLLGLLALAAVGFLLVKPFYAPIGRGIGGFYLGGCAYLAYEWLVARGWVRGAAIALGCISAALWILSVLVLHDFLYGGHAALLAPLQRIDGYWPTVVLTFPLTILSLALAEHWRGTLGKRLAIIGDISYSSYMIQFPLQLAFALVALRWSLDFGAPYMLTAFFAVLIALSIASHRYLEVPLQRRLRSLRPRPASAARGT